MAIWILIVVILICGISVTAAIGELVKSIKKNTAAIEFHANKIKS